MIYKIVAILAIIGLAVAHTLPGEKPSDLILAKMPSSVVALSGADPVKIFGNSVMQLAPLGPPHFKATDLSIDTAFTIAPLQNWSVQIPEPLVSVRAENNSSTNLIPEMKEEMVYL